MNKDMLDLLVLVRFTQKLILWYRDFHKLEEIFENKTLKKKFYKFLSHIIKSTIRVIKFKGYDFCTSEAFEKQNKEVEAYL